MISREELMRCIPKPRNEDVIIYNIELKDLIDVNVVEEYNKLYPIFIKKKNEYLDYKKRIEEYNNVIDSIYLYNQSWSESDYLLAMKNDKKTYNTLYHDIYILNNKLEMLQRRLNSINEKIVAQENMESREVKEKNKIVDKEIEEEKSKISTLKEKRKEIKKAKASITERIKENQEDFLLLQDMKKQMDEGHFKCKYCGSVVKSIGEDSNLHKRLVKNVEKNADELKELNENLEKLNTSIKYYNEEINSINVKLTNDLSFKEQQNLTYKKKSMKILELEGMRDNVLEQIEQHKNLLKFSPQANTNQYKILSQKIGFYETSLTNLKKLKELKDEQETITKNYKELSETLKIDYSNIEKYLKFLDIYYKIYEQKANMFFGSDFKFKLYKIENYKIIDKLEITYKNTPYYSLSYAEREAVDTILMQKLNIDL